MKTDNETIGLMIGKGDATTKDICRSLAKEGISAIVKQKETHVFEADDTTKHWSGQPGKDLFFNGWKLLF
ncbi:MULTISPECIES: hypothetical protein [Spirosoma]|uniref:Uncharacterized protein n=2 Tax=Spirosoma TaxID=107 RepID=A0A6G9AXF8_9BACT|nr:MULTISPECIES: hypothetical protein [Spirosoma]QHV99449.1 hypothetical protein GJR95_32520 [Spirosoma endbachense]QIP17036.1 hypothetical protein G8759_32575 [Spirosoma aureum]